MNNTKRQAANLLAVENSGRPAVQIWGSRGMVSSMHPCATDAAIEILRHGGNAMDAAVGLGAAISVTSHDWSGIAGDSAWLVYHARTGEFHYLDGYSTCPSSITPDLLTRHFGLQRATNERAFQEEPPDWRHVGVVTGMVPGTPAAWAELAQRFGALPFAELFKPAIALAEDGFPINRYFASSLVESAAKLLPFESTRQIVCKQEKELLHEGERLQQRELAETLRRLAQGGRAEFYGGETGRLLVDYCSRHGGLISKEDLLRYQPVWRPVLRGVYRRSDVIVSSPPTAGVHVLQALNVLEDFDLSRLGYHNADSLHVLIESLKFSLGDRRAAGGDPDFLKIDVERLGSKAYAMKLRSKIRLDRIEKMDTIQLAGESTTHFVVVDGAGNMVSATQTIGSRFGCGEVIEGTGMFMNDRTWWMALANSPNMVAAGHRANIGHAPTMLAMNGRPYVALGSPGGFGIVQYVVQVIVNMIDYGMDIQDAIEAPRFKIQDLNGQVGMEKRINAAAKNGLAALGHNLFDFPEWSDRVGGIEGVYVAPGTGHMLGGYDPRRNSIAVGIS